MFFVNLLIFPYISNEYWYHNFIGQNILAADTRRQSKLFAFQAEAMIVSRSD